MHLEQNQYVKIRWVRVARRYDSAGKSMWWGADSTIFTR